MLTNKEVDALSNEERRAWIDAMSDDEPPDPADRARLSLDHGRRVRRQARPGHADRCFTAEAMAAIKPICETGYQIFREARTADTTDDGIESTMLLSSWEVFHRLVALNPSLMLAIRLCRRMH